MHYHVKTQREDGRSADIVFHIPIPIEDNSAGVSLRTAVSEYVKPRNNDGSYGTFNSKIQGIDAGELTQLQNGELFEVSESVDFLAADTNGDKLAKIEARYTALTTGALTKTRSLLKFWGLEANVA